MSWSSRISGRVACGTVALSLALAGCGGDDNGSGPGPTGGPQVNATDDLRFSPSVLDIVAGETIKWLFGTVEHNVVFADTGGRPSDIANSRNTTVSRTFSIAGAFQYTCSLHTGMSGTIRVTAAPSRGYQQR